MARKINSTGDMLSYISDLSELVKSKAVTVSLKNNGTDTNKNVGIPKIGSDDTITAGSMKITDTTAYTVYENNVKDVVKLFNSYNASLTKYTNGQRRPQTITFSNSANATISELILKTTDSMQTITAQASHPCYYSFLGDVSSYATVSGSAIQNKVTFTVTPKSAGSFAIGVSVNGNEDEYPATAVLPVAVTTVIKTPVSLTSNITNGSFTPAFSGKYVGDTIAAGTTLGTITPTDTGMHTVPTEVTVKHNGSTVAASISNGVVKLTNALTLVTDVQIIAECPYKTFTVTLNISNGQITSGDKTTQVKFGSKATWSVSADTGYKLPTSVTNGTISGTTITSNTITAATTVTAVCVIEQKDSNLTVSPTSFTAYVGSSANVTISADKSATVSYYANSTYVSAIKHISGTTYNITFVNGIQTEGSKVDNVNIGYVEASGSGIIDKRIDLTATIEKQNPTLSFSLSTTSGTVGTFVPIAYENSCCLASELVWKPTKSDNASAYVTTNSQNQLGVYFDKVGTAAIQMSVASTSSHTSASADPISVTVSTKATNLSVSPATFTAYVGTSANVTISANNGVAIETYVNSAYGSISHVSGTTYNIQFVNSLTSNELSGVTIGYVKASGSGFDTSTVDLKATIKKYEPVLSFSVSPSSGTVGTFVPINYSYSNCTFNEILWSPYNNTAKNAYVTTNKEGKLGVYFNKVGDQQIEMSVSSSDTHTTATANPVTVNINAVPKTNNPFTVKYYSSYAKDVEITELTGKPGEADYIVFNTYGAGSPTLTSQNTNAVKVQYSAGSGDTYMFACYYLAVDAISHSSYATKINFSINSTDQYNAYSGVIDNVTINRYDDVITQTSVIEGYVGETKAITNISSKTGKYSLSNIDNASAATINYNAANNSYSITFNANTAYAKDTYTNVSASAHSEATLTYNAKSETINFKVKGLATTISVPFAQTTVKSGLAGTSSYFDISTNSQSNFTISSSKTTVSATISNSGKQHTVTTYFNAPVDNMGTSVSELNCSTISIHANSSLTYNAASYTFTACTLANSNTLNVAYQLSTESTAHNMTDTTPVLSEYTGSSYILTFATPAGYIKLPSTPSKGVSTWGNLTIDNAKNKYSDGIYYTYVVANFVNPTSGNITYVFNTDDYTYFAHIEKEISFSSKDIATKPVSYIDITTNVRMASSSSTIASSYNTKLGIQTTYSLYIRNTNNTVVADGYKVETIPASNTGIVISKCAVQSTETIDGIEYNTLYDITCSKVGSYSVTINSINGADTTYNNVKYVGTQTTDYYVRGSQFNFSVDKYDNSFKITYVTPSRGTDPITTINGVIGDNYEVFITPTSGNITSVKSSNTNVFDVSSSSANAYYFNFKSASTAAKLTVSIEGNNLYKDLQQEIPVNVIAPTTKSTNNLSATISSDNLTVGNKFTLTYYSSVTPVNISYANNISYYSQTNNVVTFSCDKATSSSGMNITIATPETTNYNANSIQKNIVINAAVTTVEDKILISYYVSGSGAISLSSDSGIPVCETSIGETTYFLASTKSGNTVSVTFDGKPAGVSNSANVVINKSGNYITSFNKQSDYSIEEITTGFFVSNSSYYITTSLVSCSYDDYGELIFSTSDDPTNSLGNVKGTTTSIYLTRRSQ